MIVMFEHVSKTYDQKYQALNDVHFQIDRGEFVFLMGPSGAGKSTLLKMMYMDEKPDSGEVILTFNQKESYRSSEASPSDIQRLRRKMGMVFQDFKLLKDRNVFDNVAFSLEVAGKSGTRLKNRVYEVLTQTGIIHKALAYPLQLSGGEQQRVSIARALANDPYLLVADEPTGNLDPQSARAVIEIFQDIHAKGTTILMATHNLNLVNTLRYRTLKLDSGQLMNREEF